jgi:hypothetical protein
VTAAEELETLRRQMRVLVTELRATADEIERVLARTSAPEEAARRGYVNRWERQAGK